LHPVFARFGELTLYWYGVMLALAFLASLASASWLGRRQGKPFSLYSDLLFWIVVSGILGARLAYVAANLPEFIRDPLLILNVRRGGLVYYGGFIGAAAALAVFARRRGEPLRDLADVVAASVPIGHVFGRIGCFLFGCCHGTLSSGPLAVRFPAESLAWENHVRRGLIGPEAPFSLSVHPVQIYESVLNLALYAVLVLAFRRPHVSGRIAALYLMLYPVARFGLEFLRGDHRLQPGAGLDAAQWTSVALFVAGLLLWISLGRTGNRRPTAV
jgi:phosphatidylglycerol:prolipoprotein diacylglycerol transferase